VARRAWLAASIAAGVVSVLIAVSGGLVASVGGVRVSARSWRVAAALALVAAAAWAWSARKGGAARADLEALGAFLDARGQALVHALAGLTVVVALVFATYSASGSDASGYLSQASMWSHLATRVADPLVILPDWPLAPGGTAPLGWRPALEGGWQVPTYAPGLPWLMAMPHAMAGTTGAVFVVALAAGLAVWCTGALARRMGGGVAALLASLLLATSPTFLYQAFQPMSDVPVTAAWAACWWLVARGSPARAGTAAALAIAVRPNLAPLAAIPWAVVMLGGASAVRRAHAVRFAAPVACAGVVIAVLQWRWYGSPLASGYGAAEELFAIANLRPNLGLYTLWMWEAERAFVLTTALAIAAWAWGQAPNPRKRRRFCDAGRNCDELGGDGACSPGVFVAALLLFAAGVTLAYLVYAVFEVWSYVRFLLPAMAVAAAMGGAALGRALGAIPAAWRGVAVLILGLVASADGLQSARSLGVFQVADVTARAREVGSALAMVLPPRTVLLAGEQSGSMRYATGRPIVRWETLNAASLQAVLSVLDAQGYEVWWVLDQFEEALVRARFPGVPEALLDWPPDVEGGPLMRTRAWRVRSASGARARP
jgi:hypothetical protein